MLHLLQNPGSTPVTYGVRSFFKQHFGEDVRHFFGKIGAEALNYFRGDLKSTVYDHQGVDVTKDNDINENANTNDIRLNKERAKRGLIVWLALTVIFVSIFAGGIPHKSLFLFVVLYGIPGVSADGRFAESFGKKGRPVRNAILTVLKEVKKARDFINLFHRWNGCDGDVNSICIYFISYY